jgi:hypothetical protein
LPAITIHPLARSGITHRDERGTGQRLADPVRVVGCRNESALGMPNCQIGVIA